MVSVLFVQYALPFQWMLFGVIEVVSFFYFSNILTKRWKDITPKLFVKKLFFTALIIRLLYVIFSYFFFLSQTGVPFEFQAADALGYDESARWIADLVKTGDLYSYFEANQGHFSDMGYPVFLGIQYFLTGSSIIIARIIKAILSAYTCVLIYKIAQRNFGEGVSRIAAIFCLLMPNLIYYCGMHLKESEMVFLTVMFVERADFLLRSKKYTIFTIVVPLLLASSLFFFRTILGITSLFAFISALIFSSSKLVGRSKRIVVGFWIIFAAAFLMGGSVATEVEELWQKKETEQEISMQWRAERDNGNQFAKYAGASIFAPLIFTIPFPTIINTPEQENQQMINGGNYVKNILSFFIIFAFFSLIFQKKWRQHSLLIFFVVGYLGIITLSSFAQSERFHLPILPFSLMFAAYGLSILKKKHVKWFNVFLFFEFVALIGWSWFKLAGRGII